MSLWSNFAFLFSLLTSLYLIELRGSTPPGSYTYLICLSIRLDKIALVANLSLALKLYP